MYERSVYFRVILSAARFLLLHKGLQSPEEMQIPLLLESPAN